MFGISRWKLPVNEDVVNAVVNYYGHDDPTTVVVHLDPGGVSLIVDEELFDHEEVMQEEYMKHCMDAFLRDYRQTS